MKNKAFSKFITDLSGCNKLVEELAFAINFVRKKNQDFEMPANRFIIAPNYATNLGKSSRNSAQSMRFSDTRLVICLVISATRIKESHLVGISRGRRRLSTARQIAQYLCHVVYGENFTDIGRLTYRDRTSVAYACRCVEEKRDSLRWDKALFFAELSLHAMSKSLRVDFS